MSDVIHAADLNARERALLFWASFLSLAAAGVSKKGDPATEGLMIICGTVNAGRNSGKSCRR